MNNTKSNNYLKFDMTRMVNLEYSLQREVLRTNRRGAYHCTTLVECNTRKQHGLLVVPIAKFDYSRHVLLSSFDETVVQHGSEFNLGIHKYDGDNYNPMGHKYIREFSCDALPRTIYRVGGVILSKEKMFSLEDNTIFIRYTLLDVHSPTTMRFRPSLAFREINQLTQENTLINHGYKEIENGINMCLYTGYPDLFMQFNKESRFVFDPCWIKGVEYQKDKDAGLPYREDLYMPGYFELTIEKGESIIFSASDKQADPSKLVSLFEEGVKERTPRSSFYNCLKNSAHQFHFKPSKDELYLFNNYPWGYVNAREQFMALHGLTISLDKESAFEEIVDTAIPAIRSLMKGESEFGLLRDLDAPDVLFWLLRALHHFATSNKKRFYEKYASLVTDIVAFVSGGYHSNIQLLENNLLYTNGKDRPASWMDVVDNGKPIIQRTGCLVEMNAFWYNSLMFNADIAKEVDNTKLQKEMETLAIKVRASFVEVFVNDAGYLYDFVDDGYVDWSVRPNMLLALAGAYPLLDKRQSKSILDIVTKELLTPKGIRSLSPKSYGFRPLYEGSRYDKGFSSFNGGAWPWLLYPYMEAYLKVFQRSGYSFLSRLLIGIEDEMANNCIGSLSQVYDGSLPYAGHSAISSAINVAGVLEALNLQSTIEDEY